MRYQQHDGGRGRWASGWVLAGAVLLGVLPAGDARGQERTKPLGVTTIFSYYDALRAVAGDDAGAVLLLPPRQSPHEYQPTVRDKAAVARADLVVLNGLSLDRWGEKLARDGSHAAVLTIGAVVRARGIEPLRTEALSLPGPASTRPVHEGGGEPAAGNPHVWLDPRVQAMAAEAIGAALAKIDPAHQEGYARRAAAYVADIRKLDDDFHAATARFKRKEFIGFHAAYAYLAARYGLTQVATIEEIPEQGPSLAQTAGVIRLIREKNIKVIFVETALPARPAELIARETGATLGVLQPLETYDDKDQTYVSLMRDNLAALKKALE